MSEEIRMRDKVDIIEILKNENPTKIVAPMVRYSKLPFRILCRRWGADIATTPMIIAESFNRSEKARDSDFCTTFEEIKTQTEADTPLVVQFGTNNPLELALAAQKVSPYVDGIDLNCGCPQRWAVQEGIGAALSAKPETVSALVSAAVRGDGVTVPVSIKIRLHRDMRRTMDLVKAAEMAGVSWIGIHGRTVEQRTRVPVSLENMKIVREAVSVPTIANGDVFMPADISRFVKETGVNGVMSARGILANPAMFAGYDEVPIECASQYLDLALKLGGRFSINHHHLMYMLFRHLSRAERNQFATLCSMIGIIDFFEERNWLLSQMSGENTSLKNDK
jgi:tRNA-dihydrouridine synthase 4